MSVSEALLAFRSSMNGLSLEEASRRFEEFGPNRLARRGRVPWWRRLVGHLMHRFAVMLWVAALLCVVSEAVEPGQGMVTLAAAIVVVIGVNGSFSYVQEARAERALESLATLLPASVTVVRDGGEVHLDSVALVPGDVVSLEAGDRIPADARILESQDVRVDNATLTGESVPVWRSAEPSDALELAVATSMMLAGTTLVSGHARVLVVATGEHTELASIAALAEREPVAVSPLQREVARVARIVAWLALGLAACFALLGLAVGMTWSRVLLFAVGILVANVPEGLMPTTTLALAMASQRMAARRVLVRNLPAVEALGRASVICTDKTGTLTENRMRVATLLVAGESVDVHRHEALAECATRTPELFEALYLCESLRVIEGGGPATRMVDPTERALFELAHQALSSPPAAERLEELPFEPDRRRLTTLHADRAGYVVHVKGALEALLPLARAHVTSTGEQALGESQRSAWLEREAELCEDGLRVIAVAYRRLAARPARSQLEDDLVLVGLVALAAPPRPEVPAAIERCKRAGIRVIMLTGDHPRTAVAVARRIGLASASCRVITGQELSRMRPARLQLALDEEVVFARVAAEQKLRIVRALQRKRAIVAVTGDGVNDAPALRAADVGIAMGLGGTDVARESADVVLLDDNFASIVAGVEEGRTVYRNIRKFLTYVLASNVPELVPYLAYGLFGVPLPLTIVQILAVDLGTDLLPALGLGAEQAEPGIMDEPPLASARRLLDRRLLVRAYGVLGVSEALASMSAYALVVWLGSTQTEGSASTSHAAATTACFAGIVVMQMVNVFCCRSEREHALRRPLSASRLLWVGVGLEVVLLAGFVYTPLGARLLGTAPFPPVVWLALLPFAVLHVAVDAGLKVGHKRRARRSMSSRG